MSPLPGGFSPKKTPLQILLEQQAEARKTALQATANQTNDATKKISKYEGTPYVEPDNPVVTQKIRIIFDDSGSMDGQKIEDARQGCIEFLRNCEINKVACAIHPINMDALDMETNLPELAELIKHIHATGETPLYTTLEKAQDEEIKATRFIVFSDGSPTDAYGKYNHSTGTTVAGNPHEEVINKAIEAKTPIDTVWITENLNRDSVHSSEHKVLKELADKTGGFFLIFDRNKVNFREAFKYLSPGLRHLLVSDVFRDNLQQGKV